jgi:hypothetical protein
MTTAGWIFMLSSIAFVLVLCGYCFTRVIRKPSAADHMHSTLEADEYDPHKD